MKKKRKPRRKNDRSSIDSPASTATQRKASRAEAHRQVDATLAGAGSSTASSSTPKSDVTLRASFIGVFGAPECGKSTVIKALLRELAAPRLVVFDPGHEYDIGPQETNELTFYDAINAGRAWSVFRPSFDRELRCRQFDRFCAAGLSIARSKGSCAVIVDELHLVTGAGHAPEHWRELVETGRKFGLSSIAASIRPALIDKTFWTSATMIRTGRLNFTEDQKTLANALNVDVSEVAALTGYDWIQRDMRTGIITRSSTSSPAPAPA